jgi:hypothetical protein
VQALPAGGNIRRSIEAALEQQNRFPLDTANHLRSRLRRMRFAIYKRGSKGVSYVCAVKRRFRDPSTRFSDSVDRLIQFIEKNPYIYAAELPEKFLGVKPPALEPPEPAAPVEASEASTEAEAAASGDDAGQAVAPSEDPRGAPASEGPTRAAETSEASPPSAADNPEVTALKRDLHWLVSEGYVSEFHDGRLFAQPVLEQARRGDNQTGERQHQEGLSQAPTSSPKEAEETSAESPTNTSTSDDASAADISKAPAPAATAAANESSPVAGGDSKEASAGSERVTRGEGAEKDEIISASDPAAATESVSEAGKPADPAEPNVPPANLAPADLEARGDSAASSENMEPTREEEPSSKAGETSREEA